MKNILIIFLLIIFAPAFAAEEIYTYKNDPFKQKALAVKKPKYKYFVRYISYSQLNPEIVKNIINNLYPTVRVNIDQLSKQFILKGREDQLINVEQLINQLDKNPKQISIEAKIIEVSESGLKQIGILWNITQEGIRFGTNTEADLEGLLKTLEGRGAAKILATPKITSLENKEAFVRIGDRIPYALPVGNNSLDNRWTIQYLDAGIILNIKPSLSISNNIIIELHPQVINLKEWKPTPAGDFPILSSREAKTIIQVKSGESVAIAGLRNEEEKENITKIPLLGDIPLLGEVFKYRSKEKVQTEVVFIVTPKIL